ncbi:DUF4337 family protein [Sphingomonas sp.]|uniref:DUF4337 family protein n=1 Tax=Sphingomonas sp. TaxID=28214 RepID=UPI003B00A0E4
MELEMSAEAKDRRLNRRVAVTVMALAVWAGLCNIKDGNIVQAMQQAQADAVDRWGEYQADKTKLRVAETARLEIAAIATGPRAAAALRPLDSDIAKYRVEAPALARQAKDFAAAYEALNVHDDQFDAAEALGSTAISLAAMAALVDTFALLIAGWSFAAGAVFLGLCGFMGWAFHPAVLSGVLG